MHALELFTKGGCFNGHNIFSDSISQFSFYMEDLHMITIISCVAATIVAAYSYTLYRIYRKYKEEDKK